MEMLRNETVPQLQSTRVGGGNMQDGRGVAQNGFDLHEGDQNESVMRGGALGQQSHGDAALGAQTDQESLQPSTETT